MLQLMTSRVYAKAQFIVHHAVQSFAAADHDSVILTWKIYLLVAVMRVSDYRRKRLEPYASHELFRPDHEANVAIRALAQRDAMQDCASWLAAGNSVAVSIIA